MSFVHLYLIIPQYLKPFGGHKYTDAVATLRKVGEYCIKQRIEAIRNQEDVPHDILTQIITLTQKEDTCQLEDLIDDFMTFYGAGKKFWWYHQYCVYKYKEIHCSQSRSFMNSYGLKLF